MGDQAVSQKDVQSLLEAISKHRPVEKEPLAQAIRRLVEGEYGDIPVAEGMRLWFRPIVIQRIEQLTHEAATEGAKKPTPWQDGLPQAEMVGAYRGEQLVLKAWFSVYHHHLADHRLSTEAIRQQLVAEGKGWEVGLADIRSIQRALQKGYGMLADIIARLLATPDKRQPRPLPIGQRIVGRESEMQTLRTLLSQPTTRLVTVVGTFGLGKTTLALEVARKLVTARTELPVHFVGLDLNNEPNHSITGAIAESFQPVLDADGTATTDTLVRAFGQSNVVLILDSCDRVLEAVRLCVDALLPHCENLQIVATSRERLGLPYEKFLPLPPLDNPRDLERATVLGLTEAYRRFDSVKLFVQRAQQAYQARGVPSPTLRHTDTRLLLDICAHLDANPLAIELAAARSTEYTLEQIEAFLSERLRLLRQRGRSGPARHTSLEAAIAWSYDQLSESQQQYWCRLGSFPRSWRPMDAHAIAGEGSDLVTNDILHTALLEKSLIHTVTLEPHPRFHLLESLRLYAREQLRSEEYQSATESLAAHYADRLKRGKGDKSRWLAELDPETPNVLATLTHYRQSGDGHALAKFLVGIDEYLAARGDVRQVARQALAWALEKERELPHGLRARALHVAGKLYLQDRQLDEARRMAKQALELRREMNESGGTAKALTLCGHVERAAKSLEEAAAHYEEAYKLLTQSQRELPSGLLGNLANVALARGDMRRAVDLADEAILVVDEANTTAFVSTLLYRGRLASMMGDTEYANALCDQALNQARALPHPLLLGKVHAHKAFLSLEAGDLDRTTTHVVVLGRFIKAGRLDSTFEQQHTVLEGLLARAKGNHEEARRCLESALSHAQQMETWRGIAIISDVLGQEEMPTAPQRAVKHLWTAHLARVTAVGEVGVPAYYDMAQSLDEHAMQLGRHGYLEDAWRALGGSDAIRAKYGFRRSEHRRGRLQERMAETGGAVSDGVQQRCLWRGKTDSPEMSYLAVIRAWDSVVGDVE